MFLLGHWKNFDELEESLTIEEMNAIIQASRDQEMRNWEFQASLKGIDLKKDKKNDRFDEIKKRAEARLYEELGEDYHNPDRELTLEEMGIKVESE